jgi:predicted lysophospholipase L1 biosynthesis ABC-type transport system permease subunit
MNQSVKQTAGPLGLGAVACAACCAGPIVAALAGLGAVAGLLAILAGALVIGLVILATVIGVMSWRRTNRSPLDRVPVELSASRPAEPGR